MGKRKSSASKKMNAKKPRIEKLDEEFECPFCNYPKSVACTFSEDSAEVRCYVCDEHYVIDKTPLTEAIDVYSEWIDACVEVNKKEEEPEEEEDEDEGWFGEFGHRRQKIRGFRSPSASVSH